MELEPLFNQIVDAIHEKDGKSDGIAAIDFPNRIREIPNAAPAPDGFFTVTVQSDNPDMGTVSGGGIVQNGVNITVKATSADVNLYSFVGWQVNGTTVSNNADYSFTVTENVRLTAVFTDLYVAGRDWWNTKYQSKNWAGIASGNNYFITVTSASSAFSKNGYNWNLTPSVPNNSFHSIAFGNNIFVAIAGRSAISSTVILSNNGNSWTSYSLPEKKYWYDICFGNGLFIAIAYNSNMCAFSSDGKIWTTSLLPSVDKWVSIAYGNGLFITISSSSNNVAISTDGIEWEPVNNALPINNDWKKIRFYKNGFYVVGSDTDVILFSENSKKWNSMPLPVRSDLSCIAGGNDTLVALSNSGDDPSVISYDMGAHWQVLSLPNTVWKDITFYNGKFVACGNSGNIAYSSALGPNK